MTDTTATHRIEEQLKHADRIHRVVSPESTEIAGQVAGQRLTLVLTFPRCVGRRDATMEGRRPPPGRPVHLPT